MRETSCSQLGKGGPAQETIKRLPEMGGKSKWFVDVGERVASSTCCCREARWNSDLVVRTSVSYHGGGISGKLGTETRLEWLEK